MTYSLPQAQTYIDQAFNLPIAMRMHASLQVGIIDGSSGCMVNQAALAGAVLLPGTTIHPGQYMPGYQIVHQQPSDSATSAMPRGGGAWLSRRLPDHPALVGPPQMSAQPTAMGMQAPVHAMEPAPEHGVEQISAEMKPQASMSFPESNVHAWLEGNGGTLAPQGEGLNGLTVVIVGGGQTALFMSIHLAQAGATVQVVEATDSCQGRAATHVFSDGSKAPLGMMRFGRGSAVFGGIVRALGFVMKPRFPDPGVVPTLVHYEGITSVWNDKETAPEGFENVQHHFEHFLNNGWEGLESWEGIRSHLQNDKPERARQATQAWIDRFRHATFGSAIREIFKNIWSEDDFKRFDIIGVGSGGFGVLNHVSLFAIMQLFVNGFEDQQCSLGKWNGREVEEVGADDIIEALKGFAMSKGVQFSMSTPVSSVTHNGQYHVIQTSTGLVLNSDILVCTTTLPAMVRIRGLPELLGNVFRGVEELPADCRSGKLFTLIDVSDIPEVNEREFPHVLVSDLSSRHMYLRPGRNANTRVLLMWYGWQRAYDALAGMTDDQMVEECSEVARKIVKGTKYERGWRKILENVVEYKAIRWQGHSFAGSAFQIAEPGDNQKLRDASFLWGSAGRMANWNTFSAMADLQGAGGWNEGGYTKAAIDISAILVGRGTVYNDRLAPCNLLNKNTLVFND